MELGKCLKKSLNASLTNDMNWQACSTVYSTDQMSKPIIVVGEVLKKQEKYYLKPNPVLSHVIEGEAPETDDENDVSGSSTTSTHEDETTAISRSRGYVDEKLEQCWRKMGENALMTSARRIQPAMKIINNMETCIDSALITVQAASAHIRHTSAVVCHLEDSVGALLDAAKLIPSSFEDTVNVVRNI
ncbi:hypothetical protein KIN20_010081 [Parelaphostrongylus tenuis]|uniref:Uncharacterized protein n=1 Tax=Parelaphostrongylus tenuis TaxID=148309 RepID=A0AAD5M938_PARTN|nr:hypothetical protein KIN20_010081 [Parelaphostrongylus tenuis]